MIKNITILFFLMTSIAKAYSAIVIAPISTSIKMDIGDKSGYAVFVYILNTGPDAKTLAAPPDRLNQKYDSNADTLHISIKKPTGINGFPIVGGDPEFNINLCEIRAGECALLRILIDRDLSGDTKVILDIDNYYKERYNAISGVFETSLAAVTKEFWEKHQPPKTEPKKPKAGQLDGADR